MANPTFQTTPSQTDFEIIASKYQKCNNKILNYVKFLNRTKQKYMKEIIIILLDIFYYSRQKVNFKKVKIDKNYLINHPIWI